MTDIIRPLLLSALCLAVLGGCVGGMTPPSRYYLLVADPAAAQAATVEVPNDVSVAVGPVVVPPYLDRTQIVTKRNPYQLDLAEFDVWAEPLDKNLARILVENLSRIMGIEQVFTFGERRGAPVDFEVSVDVERMDAVAGISTDLVARWTIIRSRNREHLFTRRSRLHAKLDDGAFETLAAAMSRNVADLSVEIATAIGQLAAPPH